MGEAVRATQVMRWMHQMGTDDFSAMTDLAKTLRAKLEACASARAAMMTGQASTTAARASGCWMWGTGNGVETVFIPEDDRGTLCVSSQAAARWTAPFAPPAVRASTVICPPPRSLVSCGGRTNPGVTPKNERVISKW